MTAPRDLPTVARRRVMLHDVQLCLTLALLLSGVLGLNSFRARAAARAASYHTEAGRAHDEHVRRTAVVQASRRQLARLRQDGAATSGAADSLGGAAASLLTLEEATAAAADQRASVLRARTQAALAEARWFGAGMAALLALGLLPAWEWRRVQRRGPRRARAAGFDG